MFCLSLISEKINSKDLYSIFYRSLIDAYLTHIEKYQTPRVSKKLNVYNGRNVACVTSSYGVIIISFYI